MTSVNKATVPKKASFEIPPPPIPAKDIKETVTADVVVLGAGISGLTAALSAAEAGAKTILLEKTPSVNTKGGFAAAIASRMQKQAGIEIDKDAVISTIMQWGSYRCDQQLVKLWADNCSQVIDWLIDMAEATPDIEVVLAPITRDWYFPHYPVTHFFMPRDKTYVPPSPSETSQRKLAELLWRNCKAHGVDFRFETPAVRLLRKDKGRVTGVIAQNKQGDYIQFNTRKAVVLCTGDYGSDKQMLEKYCDWRALQLYDSSTEYRDFTIMSTGADDGRVNTGDGHKMAMWVGAAIDNPPHCVMYFDSTGVGAPHQNELPTAEERAVGRKNAIEFFWIARQPWLNVNKNGERFMNEDIPWAYECNQILQQPGGVGWKVWDSKYEIEWPKFNCIACKSLGAPLYMHRPEIVAQAVETGVALTAQTIEELAWKMDVPVKTFKTTVARYNELARNEKDLDFGKHPGRLTTIEIPRFYACKVGGKYLVTLGGLKINTKLQVLDTERNAIKGLYAAGNVSGSYFGDEYPIVVPGAAYSRAWTFGRLAGLAAAAEKV